MALYAVDDDDLISASEAIPDKIYWCLDCFCPVKRRRGRWKVPHFYHLKTSPACRLYSKSEEHLIAQLELQRFFAPGEVVVEKPFVQINRVADVCWEKEKIIFEIQCSQISEAEIAHRNRDYKNAGYDVVWLLDDRRFNKRMYRSEEEFIRKGSAYFLSIKYLRVYDQFEVFFDGKRAHKGRPLPIDLRKVLYAPKKMFDPKCYPKQVINLQVHRHFYGDRLSRALRFPEAMRYERLQELGFRKPNPFKVWFKKYFIQPYLMWLKRNRYWDG